MKPSAAAVLALLRQRGTAGLSPAEARLLAGCDRLAARVCELRAEGHDIRTGSETVGSATYARYRLVHPTPAEVHASHVRLGFRSGSCELCPIQLTMLDPQDSAPGSAPSRPGALPWAPRDARPA